MWSVSGLILIVYGLKYYNHLSDNPPILDTHLYSSLAFNGGILLYFTFSLLLFIIDSYVLETQPHSIPLLWSFHNINNVLKNIAFALGLYLTGKRHLDLTKKQFEAIKKLKNLA
jgi:hypothetical protein